MRVTAPPELGEPEDAGLRKAGSVDGKASFAERWHRFSARVADSRWLSALLLALLTVAFFTRFLLFGQSFIPGDILFTWYPWKHYQEIGRPQNRLLSDVINTFYPRDTFYASELERGVIPTFDPTTLAGHPTIADGLSAELYPPRLLLVRAFGPRLAHDLLLVLHTFLAGLFANLLLRRLGAGAFGSLVGAAAWMFNGYVMVWLEYGHTVAIAALLPLAFLAYEMSVARRSLAWALLGGLAVALALTSGNLQRSLYLLIALAAYCVFRVGAEGWAGRRPGFLVWPLACLAVCLAVGFGLAAAQLAPALELIGDSQRQAQAWSELFPKGWLWAALLPTFVAPGLIGGPTYAVDLYPMLLTNANEFQGYAGLLPLLLALIAAVRRRGPALFFSLLAAGALLMAVGTPLYYIPYRLVPGFDRLGPQRILLLYAFGVAMLAGFGADYLLRAEGERVARGLRRRLLLGLGVAVLLLAVANLGLRLAQERILDYGREYVRTQVFGTPLNPRSLESYYQEVEALYGQLLAHYGPLSEAILAPLALVVGCAGVLWLRGRRPNLFPAACLLLVIVDLGYFGWRYNPTVEPSLLYPTTPAIDFLRSDGSLYRVALDSSQGTLFPNTLKPYGIEEVGGYESLYSGRYATLLAAVESGQPAPRGLGNLAMLTRFDSPLLDLLNVKYVLRPPGAPAPAAGFTLAYRDEVSVYENREVLPRALVVPECRLAPSPEVAMAIMHEPTYRPERVVVFEEDSAPRQGCGSPRGGGQAEVTRYLPDELTVRAVAPQGGWLLLSNAYYPGWKATVDGSPATIYRANFALMAVELPPGQHVVRFAYASDSFRLGSLVTLASAALALLALAALPVRHWRRHALLARRNVHWR